MASTKEAAFFVVDGFICFKDVHVQHSKILAAQASGLEPRIAARMLTTCLY
jgi:hypothetical protein